MFREVFKSGWFGKLIQLLIVASLSTSVGYFIWFLITGGNLTDVNSLKLLQFLSEIFTFIIPAIFLGYMWYENPMKKYGLNVAPNQKQIFLTILLMVCILPFINLLSYINEQLQLPHFLKILEDKMKAAEDAAANLTDKFLQAESPFVYLFNVLFIAVLPALGEELLFRGAVFNSLSEKFKKHTAVWMAAALFSLIHFQMYGFLPRMIIGAVLGYLLIWSKSLWLPVLAHFLNNAMAVSVSYFGGGPEKIRQLDDLGKADTLWTGLLSAVVSGIILWFIYRTQKEHKEIKSG